MTQGDHLRAVLRPMLVGAVMACGVFGRVSAALATDVNFGELELFDFGSGAPEVRYGWSSGDTLVAPLDVRTRIGGITGKKNAQITPAVKAWGRTIIPAVRADTRSGARLTTTLKGNAGVELTAGVTVGGSLFNATLQAGPTLTLPGPAVAGEFVKLQTDQTLGLNTTFNPGLPRFDAGLDVILDGQFRNKFEYGLFPIAKYSVGNFGFDFDLGFNLFDINIDLNLPKIPIPSFPDLPSFSIPESERDDTLFRQKIPPSNPALSVGELALDNPLQSINTASEVVDGKATFNAKGSLLRAGLDIDGIASALTTGVSFTGTSVKVGVAKMGYDIFDVKYGVELGIEYDSSVDPFLNVALAFDRPVEIKDADGNTETVTSYSGRWDELPEIALLDREDVTVDVDFTDIEAVFSHSGALTLSDYMELQAIKAQVKVGPVKLVDIGPAYYQKFPLAGEFTAIDIFETQFSLGSLAIADGIWDGSFVIEAEPGEEIYFDTTAFDPTDGGSFAMPGSYRVLGSNAVVTDLAGTRLIVGGPASGGPLPGAGASRLDLDPIDAKDTAGGGVIVAEGVTLLPGSTYETNGIDRAFEVEYLENDGLVEATKANGVPDGSLSLQRTAGVLEVYGEGEIQAHTALSMDAPSIVHGGGHTISYVDQTSSSSHVIVADTFVNSGQMNVSGTNVVATVGDFGQTSEGSIHVDAGGSITVAGSTNVFKNDGVAHVTGAGSNIDVAVSDIRSLEGGGSDDLGRIVADTDAMIQFSGPADIQIRRQEIEAGIGGSVVFDSRVDVYDDTRLITQVGGTMTLNGLVVKGRDLIDVVNHGTLEVLADSSLLPKPDNVPKDGGARFDPIDLENTGTINVRNGADFEFGVTIVDFAGDGARLVGGTWNVLGTPGVFSNRDPGGSKGNPATSITTQVLEVVQDGQILTDVFDLRSLDKSLKTNAANVKLQGQARWYFFNSVEQNEGTFTISEQHQFTTDFSYANVGGTTNVETGAKLLVPGALRVHGGAVNISADSEFTAGVELTSPDDMNTVSRSVEVIGGELNVADAGFLAGTNMFSDIASNSNPDFVSLNDGQTWVVREQVEIDLDTEVETIIPGAINLGTAIIERNEGSIIIDGADAHFDAAEAMQFNDGDLILQNGFVFDTRLDDFENTGNMTLQGASFIVAGDDGEFRNNGALVMDGDSYLQVAHFINNPDGSVHLDGVIDAPLVTITPGTSISGSGSVTGMIENGGVLDIGDSPGRVETFNGYTQGDDAVIRFEIDGFEAGVTYDQLVVSQPTADPNDPQPPTVVANLAGTIEIIFADGLTPINTEWLLIDIEGVSAGMFNLVNVEGLLMPADPALVLPLARDASDTLLGTLSGAGVFLTYNGGDGNDVVAYLVPEPASAAALILLHFAYSGRYGRRRQIA